MAATTYQLRLVAFIDILGFKELVARSESEPGLLERLVDVLEDVQRYGNVQAAFQEPEVVKAVFSDMIIFSTFSDSILISARWDRFGLMLLTQMVALISNKLLQRGIFTRGAISMGRMIHSNRVAIGEGLIRAYKLESSTAIYPRIIVDEDVLSVPGAEKDEYDQRLRRDRDGLRYLHILDKEIIRLNSMISKGSMPESETEIPKDFIEAARTEIERTLGEPSNLSVKAKVTWLAQYFNECAHELGLQPIQL